mmetsp:Transcript_22987/g.56641  ORF Transcript_22987/g.56641 Transcript_22987/m.56641 type:complete len:88 (-) Transcript_22987:653-916(-)
MLLSRLMCDKVRDGRLSGTQTAPNQESMDAKDWGVAQLQTMVFPCCLVKQASMHVVTPSRSLEKYESNNSKTTMDAAILPSPASQEA